MNATELSIIVLGEGRGPDMLAGELDEAPDVSWVARVPGLDAALAMSDRHPDAVVLPLSSSSPVPCQRLRTAFPGTILVAATDPDSRHEAVNAVPDRVDAFVTLGPGAGRSLIDTCAVVGRRGAAVPEPEATGIDVVDGLLSHISHELRTPLTAIHCSVELLANNLSGLPPDLAECMGIAMRNTDQLGKIIGDLIDAADIHRGRLPIDLECVDGNRLARDLLDSARALTASADLVLESDVERDLPWVVADIVRIRQVFANLLDNAVRHSPSGGTVSVAIGLDDAGLLQTSVTDEGPGIPPETLAHVFELFTRTTASKPSSRQGLGLGLALSRDLVQRQGGRLSVRNMPGEGATFSFTIPVFSLPDMSSAIIDNDARDPEVACLLVELWCSEDELEEMTRRSVLRECARTLGSLVKNGDLVVQGYPGADRCGIVFVLSTQPTEKVLSVRDALLGELARRPAFRGVVRDPRAEVRTVRPAAPTHASVWQLASSVAAGIQQAFEDFLPASCLVSADDGTNRGSTDARLMPTDTARGSVLLP